MDYFKDLTIYSSQHFEKALNIGWEMPGEEGRYEPDPDLLSRLGPYLGMTLNMSRGGIFRTLQIDGKEYTVGFSEIRVLGADGTVYAAPDFIAYRIHCGEYLPPEAFREALRNGPSPESDVYKDFLARYDEEHFWGADPAYKEAADECLRLIETDDFDGLCRFTDTLPEKTAMITPKGTLVNAAILLGKDALAIHMIEKGFPLDMLNGQELFTAINASKEDIAEKLIDCGVTLDDVSMQNNPLFFAIMKKSNRIAQKLFMEKKHLVRIYSNYSVQNCNILQWAKMCRNEEMFRYMSGN